MKRRLLARIAPLVCLMTFLPQLAAATVLEVRIGFRPAIPDGKPVLGRSPGIENLWFATGLGPYGLQVGPWSGAAVTDLALGTPPPLDLGPFGVARFGSR